MGHTSYPTLRHYIGRLDSGQLANDLLTLGDPVNLSNDDRALRRCLIDELCERYPEATAAFAGYDADSKPVAMAALVASRAAGE